MDNGLLQQLQEVASYEDLVVMFCMGGMFLAFNLITDGAIWIAKKIHCHRIMKKGKLHKCRYWTCEYYYCCPYNSVDFKTPKRFIKTVKENDNGEVREV